MELINEEDNVVIVLGAGASISEMDTKTYTGHLPPTDLNFLRRASTCCTHQYNILEQIFNDIWNGVEPYPIKYQRMEQLFASAYLGALQTSGTTKAGIIARKLLDTLVLLLRDTLTETTNKANPSQHLDLFNKISTKCNTMNIISLNYDTLADRALRLGKQKGYWVWSHKDGYGFKPTNCFNPKTSSNVKLFKLHGSMNWYVPTPSWRRTSAYNPNAPIYVPDPVAKKGSVVWQRRQKYRGHSKQNIFPLLVPPIYEKGNQINGKLANIWQQSRDVLRNASLVIVWGYSLPVTDYHTDLLFAQSARQAKYKLLVINPDKDALGRVTYVWGV